MDQNSQLLPARRPWQIVARERGLNLRELGELIGRRHSTMLQYSGGFRRVPQDVMEKIEQALGVPVQ